METLMHNTDPLGALLGDASDINFDNGGTDLTSDNVQGAIEELTSAENIAYDNNNSVKDKIDDVDGKKQNEFLYLGNQIGTNEQSLPASWKELLVQVYFSTGVNVNTFHLYGEQTDSYTNTGFGSYGTSFAVGQISRTKAKLTLANYGGTDVTSSTRLYYYIRQ